MREMEIGKKVLLAALATVLIASCNQPINDLMLGGQVAAADGKTLITIGDGSSKPKSNTIPKPKTILPGLPSINSYSLWADGGTGFAKIADFSSLPANASINQGTYDFKLEAKNASGDVVLAQVKLGIVVGPANVNIDFTLTPVTGGPGSLSLTVKWPSSLPVASADTVFGLLGASQVTSPATIVGSSVTFSQNNLTSGNYLITLRLKDASGNILSSVMEVARVYQYLLSEKTISLSESDFNTPPIAPTNLIASVGNAKVLLTWVDASSNETGFNIDRSTDGGVTWTILTSSPLLGGVTTYTDSAVSPGGTYSYRVSALNTLGSSSYASSNSVTLASGVSLNTSAVSIAGTATSQLVASLLPLGASNQAVNWTSSNTAVATVSNTGLVTGVSKGTTTITATTLDGGYTAIATITNTANANANISNISISQSSMWPPFDPNVFNYTVVLPASATSLTITASTVDPNASVNSPYVVNGWNFDGEAKTATLTALAEDGITKKNYNLKVFRSNNKLTSKGVGASFAIKSDGSLWGFGTGHMLGIGVSPGTLNLIKSPIKIMDGAKYVEAGYNQCLVIKEDNSLWAFGTNDQGQIGDGTTVHKPWPVQIMTDVVAVSAFGRWPHENLAWSFAIKSNGDLYAWGYNGYGQFGDGTTTNRSIPTKVMSNVASVSAGSMHTLALKNDGSLWLFGSGFLGDGKTAVSTLTPVQIMGNVKSMLAGINQSFVIKQDNSLWGFGYGYFGNGANYMQVLTPIQLMSNVSTIDVNVDVVGPLNLLVLKLDNTLWGFGTNGSGELGDGTKSLRLTSIKVSDNVTSVSMGLGSSLIMKKDGSLWSSGSNTYGELGDGTTTSRTTWGQVPNWTY